MIDVTEAVPANDEDKAAMLVQLANRIHGAVERERQAVVDRDKARADLIDAQQNAAKLIASIDFGPGFLRVLEQVDL